MQCDTLPVKLGHHKLNSTNNLWFQRNVVVNFLKSQKFYRCSCLVEWDGDKDQRKTEGGGGCEGEELST